LYINLLGKHFDLLHRWLLAWLDEHHWTLVMWSACQSNIDAVTPCVQTN